LYYTASGIVTLCRWPSGAQVVHGTATYSVTIPDAVDLLMMSTYCSKHVEAFKRLVIKQEFVH